MTVPCPSCGGTIKAAAKICKHCRQVVVPPVGAVGGSPPGAAEPLKQARDLQAAQVENLRSSVPPGTLPPAVRPPDVVPTPTHVPAPQLPPVLHELRKLLETKPFVDLANLDDLLVARQTDDALELLRQLVVVGNITQVQADALVAEFGEHRVKSAGDVVTSAQAQGLVPSFPPGNRSRGDCGWQVSPQVSSEMLG